MRKKEDGLQREGWREARGRGLGLVNINWTVIVKCFVNRKHLQI